MSSYIPRSLLDQARPETSDPTYRASMLPIGTYPNADGSGEHLGFATPGMIQEPMNALMRLLGTPSQPGTFAYGPDVGIASDNPVRSQFPAQEDMRTLLESTFGGNATRGMGAGEVAARILSDTTPSLPGAAIAGAERSQPGNVKRWTNADGIDNWLSESPHGSVHAWHDPDSNALRIVGATVDDASRGQGHGIALYQQLIDEAHRNNLPVISDASISPAAQRIYPALDRRGYTIEQNPNSYVDSTGSLLSPDFNDTLQGGHFIRPPGYTGPAFYSDQLPSLPGAVVAGAERNVLNDPTDFAGAARRAQEMFPNNPIYNRVYRGVSPREKGQVGDLADGQSRLFASTSPDVASTYAPDWLDNGAVFPLDMSFNNPMTVDAGGNIWDQIPFEGKRWSSTDDLADIATQRGHDGLVVRNVIDNNMMGQRTIPGDTYVALKRGTVTSPLTGETLFSNGLPSLWSSSIQGQQNQPYPNSLFGY